MFVIEKEKTELVFKGSRVPKNAIQAFRKKTPIEYERSKPSPDTNSINQGITASIINVDNKITAMKTRQ